MQLIVRAKTLRKVYFCYWYQLNQNFWQWQKYYKKE